MKKINKWRISEKQRTVVLLLLLIFAFSFLFWTKNQYSSNFVDTF